MLRDIFAGAKAMNTVALSILAIVILYAPGNAAVLSLPRAQKILFERNYDIQIAEQRHLKSLSEVTESKASWYPVAELFGGYGFQSKAARLAFKRQMIQERDLTIPPYIDTSVVDTITLDIDETIGDRDRVEAGIEINYPVFAGFSRSNRTEAQRQRALINELRKEQVQNRLSVQIGMLFFRWELAAAEAKTQRSLVTRISEHAAQMRNLYEGGLQPYSKVLEATAGLEASKVMLLEAESRLDSIRLEAASLLRSHDTLLTVSSYSFDRLYNQFPPASRTVNVNRPELAIFDHAITQTEHFIKSLEAQKYPHAFLNVTYRLANPGVNLGADEFVSYGTIGLQVRYMLYDGMKNHAQKQQIHYDRQILKLQKDRQVDEWRKQTRQAKMQLEQARRLENAAKASLTAAKEYESEMAQSLSAGLIAPIEYLNALNALAESQLKVSRAAMRKKSAFLQLMYACGEKIRF